MREYLGVLIIRVMARAQDILPRSWRSRCWAWLGCYRTALEVYASRDLPTRPFTVRALAACGETGQAEQRARELRGSRARLATARAVAAYHPLLACELMEGESPTPLQAAVLSAVGQRRAAADILRVLPSSLAGRPDIALLRANCGLTQPLTALNTCLRRAGLAEAASDHSPPGPFSLRAKTPLPSKEGVLVSVIVPVHNTESRIDSTIASLLDQTWRNLEVLAVEDASTDASSGRLHQLAAQDARVRVLSHPRNAGPYAARTTALAHARGEFVTFHDSDDWAHPQRIERQATPMIRHRGLIATVSNWVRMTDDGVFYVRKSWPLIHHNPASVMFRREAVLGRMGGFDLVRAGADSEFYERLKLVFGRTAVRRVSGLLAVGSHRPGSLMNDPTIGFTDHIPSPSRLGYWEAWRRWHVETLRSGRKPFMPHEEARPFPAPQEILAT